MVMDSTVATTVAIQLAATLQELQEEQASQGHLAPEEQEEEEAVADHLFQERQAEVVEDHLLGQAAEVQADLADQEVHPSEQAAEVQADHLLGQAAEVQVDLAALEVPEEVVTGLYRIEWVRSTTGTSIVKCRRISCHGMDVGKRSSASGI